MRKDSIYKVANILLAVVSLVILLAPAPHKTILLYKFMMIGCVALFSRHHKKRYNRLFILIGAAAFVISFCFSLLFITKLYSSETFNHFMLSQSVLLEGSMFVMMVISALLLLSTLFPGMPYHKEQLVLFLMLVLTLGTGYYIYNHEAIAHASLFYLIFNLLLAGELIIHSSKKQYIKKKKKA